MNLKNIYKYFSYIIALCLGLSLIYHFCISLTNRFTLFLSVLFLFTIIIGSVSNSFFRKLLVFKMKRSGGLNRILFASISLSLLFLLMLPFNITNYHKIEIQPLGTKNEKALGNEVWVKEINIDEKNLLNNELKFVGEWEFLDNTPVYTDGMNSSIIWEGRVRKNAGIILGNHPYSGLVKLNIDGREEIIDLYSSDNNIKKVDLNNLLSNTSKFEKSIVFVSDLFLLSFLIFYLITRTSSYSANSENRIGNVYKYTIPILISWLIYFFSFYPGLMSGDSLDQWRQLSTFEFGDAHPIYDTLFKLLVTRIWYSPAAIVLAQMIFLLMVLLYAFHTLAQHKVSSKVLWLTSIIISVIPTNSMMIISIWKDITYSISILLLTVILINIYSKEQAWFSKKSNVILFAVSLLLVLMFRHNGIIPVIGLIVALLFAFKSRWKQILLISISVLLCFFGSKFILTKALNMSPSPSILTFNVPIQQIASVLASSSNEIDEYQKSVIDKAMPTELWAKNYNPYLVDTIVFNPNFNMLVFNEPEYKKDFIKVWVELAYKHPITFIKSWINQTSIVWRISEPINSNTYFTEREIPVTGVETLDRYKLKSESITPELKSKITKILNRTQESDVVWFLWRPAFYIFLSIIFSIVLMFRNRLKILITVLPVFLNALGLLAAIPAQQSRYLFPSILCTFILIPLCFAEFGRKQEVRDEQGFSHYSSL
ncbi:DUF6020 family protein [Paenibacillus sp. BR1-192]|uniref:DUF6020 family protein n=1 Tax=Paenibacillus sp. BR1-192 TaxID=3032287 RepID=UPI00240DC86B|nr:DUF6020 family protein [Paenibacillus sp. BR1-192]WFB58113.1 DUF6020 family protein [Paenibacillus sp. BR1-192]